MTSLPPPQKPQTAWRTWSAFFAFLVLVLLLVGGLAYGFGTMGARPSTLIRTVTAASVAIADAFSTPLVRLAGVGAGYDEVVLAGISPYESARVQTLPDVLSVGAYLPYSGNTRFEFVGATPLPTPLPYPTTPPLPLPPLVGALPTLVSADGRTLPYAGAGCAPQGLPVQGVLTQRYHAYHLGIDIGVPLGTPVIATHSGTIAYAAWSDVGYGYLVIVQNESFITYYAHNISFNVVQGQRVGKGSVLAWSGSTGNSTGPHVHYEVRINDVPVDPLTFGTRGYASC
jgi:murein DD-endopeptidase MepM/ murein hydrolase activator NlpD